MKTLVTIIIGMMLFSITSNAQNFVVVDVNKVDQNRVKIAQAFAVNYLTKVEKGEEYIFSDEATNEMKNLLIADTQKTLHQQVLDQFGKFTSLAYSETWMPEGSSKLYVVRFKGDFDKSNKKLEIRVVLNETNKIAGFWMKPWLDMLK